MYIPRHIERTILRLSRSFPVILLTGPRQVGKTTVLEHARRTSRHAYVSLDQFEIRSAARRDPALFLQQYPPPLMIDEIQYAPELLPYIKTRVDEQRGNVSYWLTGSQHFHLMKGVSESLAGRIAVVKLLGLSVSEEKKGTVSKETLFPFRASQKVRFSRPDLTKLFGRILKGSFPRLAGSNPPPRETFYGSYVQTYIDRDLRDLLRITSLPQFETFIRLCAARTAQVLNIADLARDSGVSAPTAQEWLGTLEASGHVYLLRPYYQNVSKRLIKAPKLYFLDTGLVSYLTGWKTPETAQKGAMAGALFETFVVSELIKHFWHRGREAPLWYFRTKEKQEVDILIEQEGVVYPIEVKLGARITERDTAGMTHLRTTKANVGAGLFLCAAEVAYPVNESTMAVPYTIIERL